MRVKVFVGLLGIVLLGLIIAGRALPLQAAGASTFSSRAAADAYYLSQLARQDNLLAQAGRLLQSAMQGRLLQNKAAASLAGLAAQSNALYGSLKNSAHSPIKSVHAAACLASQKRYQALKEAQNMAAAGNFGKEAQLRLQERQGTLLDSSSRNLLQNRLILAKGMLNAKSSPQEQTLKDFYRWQSQVLPLQIEELKLAAALRVQMAKMLAAERSLGKTNFAGRALVLNRKFSALPAPAAKCSAAAEGAEKEMAALARLAEAVDLLSDDFSSDSFSRINRCSQMMQEASAQAARLQTDALKQAL